MEEKIPKIKEVKANPRYAGISKPVKVEKRWGYELIYHNDPMEVDGEQGPYIMNGYCMKLLHIREGHETSMHFHGIKHETLLIIRGELKLEYNDGYGKTKHTLLTAGAAFVIPPNFQHKLIALSDVDLVEASTPDKATDSYRVSF